MVGVPKSGHSCGFKAYYIGIGLANLQLRSLILNSASIIEPSSDARDQAPV